MKLSLAEMQRIMRENYGSLNLKGTEFTELPDNLTETSGCRTVT